MDLNSSTPNFLFPGYTSVGYKNSAIDWQGRWTDDGFSKQTGWNGTRFTFTVSGTNSVVIGASCTDVDNVDQCILYPVVDNTAALPPDCPFTSKTDIYTGYKATRIYLPDNGTHTLTVHSFSQVENQFFNIFKTKISDIWIENGATISPYTQGSRLVQTLGDSWMASYYDWTHLMDLTRYKMFSISAGKLTSTDMKNMYLYDYDGVLNAGDPVPAFIMVSYGVNDFGLGISLATAQANGQAIINQVRARPGYSTVPILFVRVPKNLGNGNDYGQYGPGMATLAAGNANTYYYNTTSLDALVDWEPGGTHLGINGRPLMGSSVNAYAISIGL